MHSLEVGQHDVPIECMVVLVTRVLDDLIRHHVAVVADEVTSAPWTDL